MVKLERELAGGKNLKEPYPGGVRGRTHPALSGELSGVSVLLALIPSALSVPPSTRFGGSVMGLETDCPASL